MRAPVLFDLALPPFVLESGAALRSHRVRVWAWGPAHDRDTLLAIADGRGGTLDKTVPTVLLVHALTGDAQVGGKGGWWEPLIGPGRALDPTRMRILCCSNLGSCYGTSGPDDPDFRRRSDERQPPTPTLDQRGSFVLDDALPATVTPWDQAHSIAAALDMLGVEELALVAGGSLGGMITLCLHRLLPGRIGTLLPIAACMAASPWIIGWNHVGRQTLVSHGLAGPNARRGLELARQVAMITYRAEPGFEQRHARNQVGCGDWSPTAPYSVQTYLEYQGQKLADRFTPAAYFVQLGAMDHHDVTRQPPAHAVRSPGRLAPKEQRVVSVGISSDALYLPHHAQQIAEAAARDGRTATYREIVSPHGHDAFLIEWGALEEIVRDALSHHPGVDDGATTPVPTA